MKQTTGSIILLVSGLCLVAGLAQLFIIGHSTLGNDVCFALTVIGVALFVVLDPARARRLVTGRAVRYGSHSLLMSVAFLGLITVANAFVTRHGVELDLTEGREFTLTPPSIQVAQRLQDPVHVLAFFADDDPSRMAAENLLKAYGRANPLVTYEFIDPEKSPDRAREYGADAFGATLFERGSRRQRVTMGATEQNYTAALLRVSRQESKKVYFLAGHDERNITDESPSGYLVAQQTLRRQGYEVQPLNLATSGSVPADAAALIAAAPVKPMLPEEETAISDFVERGGGLLVLADVKLPAPLAVLLKRWGIELDNDAVVDPAAGLFGDVSAPVVTKFEFDAVAGGLAAVFFPGARSLTVKSPSSEVLAMPVARTSPDSWGETNFANRQVNYDSGEDIKGPLTLVAAVETKTTAVEQATGGKAKVRIAVVGDSDFVANGSFSRLSNGDLFLNLVNWLSHDEIVLAINPHPDRLRKVMLTAQNMRMVFYSTTLFLPAAVLLLAGVIWWRRR